MHHEIFNGIKFQVGANITSKYENGQIWTHVWAWWSAEGKKSKEEKEHLRHTPDRGYILCISMIPPFDIHFPSGTPKV